MDGKIVLPNQQMQEDSLPESVREKVEAFLADRKLNAYGDPEGTFYPGGTPLFDETTGKSRSRWSHLKARFPELARLDGGKS